MPWSMPSTIRKWFGGRRPTSPSSSTTSTPTVDSPSFPDENWTTRASNLTALFCLSRPAPPRPALPAEIILQVLSHPTRWLLTHSQSLKSRISVTQHELPIITLPPFTANDLNSLRRVVFRFRSKDQGYSWDRQNHGIYRGSWTWFEAVVQEQPSVDLDAARAPPGHRPYSQHVKKKWELQRNRHAGTQYEDYEIVCEDGDAMMKELKEVMREGDHLELRACAAFPAWVNQVEDASVEVWSLDDMRSRDGDR